MKLPLGVSARSARAKRSSKRDYLVRFLFGGLVTATAGVIGDRYGPVLGGVFLAFPSILPASLTLIAKHSGNSAAAGADAVGAVLGGAALVVFGVMVWGLAQSWLPWLLLPVLFLVWLVVACALWAWFEHSRRQRRRLLAAADGGPRRTALHRS